MQGREGLQVHGSAGSGRCGSAGSSRCWRRVETAAGAEGAVTAETSGWHRGCIGRGGARLVALQVHEPDE